MIGVPEHLKHRVKKFNEENKKNPEKFILDEDMPVQKFIAKAFRFDTAAGRKARLRHMEKPLIERECNLCLFRDTFILPNLLWMCLPCAIKYAERYGGIRKITEKTYLFERPCDWCKKKRFTHIQCNVWMCKGCAGVMARNMEGAQKAQQVYFRKVQKALPQIGRTVA